MQHSKFRVQTPSSLPQVPGNVFIKEPPELRVPRAGEGDVQWAADEWRQSPEYHGLSAQFTRNRLMGKIDAIISDIEEIRDDAIAASAAPPKVIVFSNFTGPFPLLRKALKTADITFSCAPPLLRASTRSLMYEHDIYLVGAHIVWVIATCAGCAAVLFASCHCSCEGISAARDW